MQKGVNGMINKRLDISSAVKITPVNQKGQNIFPKSRLATLAIVIFSLVLLIFASPVNALITTPTPERDCQWWQYGKATTKFVYIDPAGLNAHAGDRLYECVPTWTFVWTLVSILLAAIVVLSLASIIVLFAKKKTEYIMLPLVIILAGLLSFLNVTLLEGGIYVIDNYSLETAISYTSIFIGVFLVLLGLLILIMRIVGRMKRDRTEKLSTTSQTK